jgi:hypothetical protein
MKWMTMPDDTGGYNDDDESLSIINVIWAW